MSFTAQLRAHAWDLLERPGRPKQVTLRRAVSAAYYALFHALIDAALSHALPDAAEPVRLRASRSFQHGEMKAVCRQFTLSTLPSTLQPLLSAGVPPSLSQVAESFIELQDRRHDADYDLAMAWVKSTAIDLLDRMDEALALMTQLRDSPEYHVFLAALIFGRRWDR